MTHVMSVTVSAITPVETIAVSLIVQAMKYDRGSAMRALNAAGIGMSTSRNDNVDKAETGIVSLVLTLMYGQTM
jgi:hypothetical protein